MRQYQTDTLKPIREEYCKETVHRILCCSDHPFMYTEKRTEDDNKRRNTGTVAKHRDIPCRMRHFKQIWEEYSKNIIVKIMQENNKILIYTDSSGLTKIDVRLTKETLWLTQAQMCELYQTSKSNVSEHIKHIFEEGELQEDTDVRKFRTTAADGKSYLITFYSLERRAKHEV